MHKLKNLWIKTPFLIVRSSLFPGEEGLICVQEAIEELERRELLVSYIQARQREIEAVRDQAQALVASERAHGEVAHLHAALTSPFQLEAIEGGHGGTLLLKNAQSTPLAVIKPVGEYCFELNNARGFATPLPDCRPLRISPTIPRLSIVHQEVLGYQIASLAGLAHIVPKTTLTILESDHFHDVADGLEIPELGGSKRKLVSVQEFVSGALLFSDVETKKAQLKEEFVVNQQALEDVNLFLWISGDQDSNLDNFLLYLLPDETFGLIKIDNGQVCGEDVIKGFRNYLPTAFPRQMNTPLSEKGREILFSLPVSQIMEKMRLFGRSEKAIEAFQGRMEGIQQFLRIHPSATLHAITGYVENHYSGVLILNKR